MCASFHFILCHVTQALLTRLHIPPAPSFPSLPGFNFPLCEEGFTFVLLCNEQMPAVDVLLCLCLWDSCQRNTERGGGTASHYIIADDRQCVLWRLKEMKTEASLCLPLFSLSLLIYAYLFLSHVSLNMSLHLFIYLFIYFVTSDLVHF